MSASNLVRPVFSQSQRERKAAIVAQLEEQLEMAKRGEISAMITVFRAGSPTDLSGGDNVHTCVQTSGDLVEEFGMVEILRAHVTRKLLK